MSFKARYTSYCGKHEYWRTIYADNINEAIKMADRLARKGYVVIKISLFNQL